MQRLREVTIVDLELPWSALPQTLVSCVNSKLRIRTLHLKHHYGNS